MTEQIAPRVTPQRIKELMDSMTYDTARLPNTTTTLAAARLPNGFTVTIGKSLCVDPTDFHAETGEKLAIGDAATKARELLWEFEAYANARDHERRGACQVQP
jgi:hypothetical protein